MIPKPLQDVLDPFSQKYILTTRATDHHLTESVLTLLGPGACRTAGLKQACIALWWLNKDNSYIADLQTAINR